MTKPPRIDRKLLKDSDLFVQRGRSLFERLGHYRSRFLSVFLVGLIIVAAVYGYDWWVQKQAVNGWKAYNLATKDTGLEYTKNLSSVFEKFSQTRPSYFAAVKLADYYFDERKKELAKDANATQFAGLASEWYGKALQYRDVSLVEKQLLLIDRGQSFELEKKLDEALAMLKLAADLGGETKALALLHSAFVYELKNDEPTALETYQKILVDFQNTEYARLARNHLRQLKSPIFRASAQKRG